MAIFGGFGGDPNEIAVNPDAIRQAMGGMQAPQQGGLQQEINRYAAMPAPQPEKRGGIFGGGFGQVMKTLLGSALDGVAMHYGGKPGYANRMEHERGLEEIMRKAQLEEQARQRARQEGNQDYELRKGIDQRYAPPKDPYRFEDNAGNGWERGPDGQNRLVFTDRAPKQFLQEGQLIQVQNPFTAGAPQDGGVQEGQTATNPQTNEKVIFRGGQWVPAGGGASNGTGGFQP